MANEQDIEIKITAEDDSGSSGVDRVRGKLESLVGLAPGMSAKLATIGAGLVVSMGAAVVAAGAFVAKMGDIAKETNNMAQRLGYSVEVLGQWQAVASSAGVAVESFATAQSSLSKNFTAAANGGRQQSAIFKALDIDVTKATNSSELMLQVADRFSQMADGPAKTALAMRLMGESGAKLIPVLNGGREGIEASIAAAEKYGSVMTEEMIGTGLRVNQALGETQMGLTGIRNVIFNALAPAVATIAESFNVWIASLIESYQQGGVVRQIVDVLSTSMKVCATVVLTLGSALAALITGAVSTAISSLQILWGVVQAVAAAFRGDFAGAAAVFNKTMDDVTKRSKKAAEDIGGNFGNLKKSMSDLWGDTAKNPKTGSSGTGEAPVVPAGAARSQTSIWQEEWTQRETASKDFFDRNKAEELAFWQSKIAMTRDGSQERASVERKVFELQKSMAREQLQEELAVIGAKQEAARGDFSESMRLQDEKLAALARTYGEDSAQYSNALREKERMVRQHNQLLLQIERDRISTVRQIALGEADTANEIAQINMQAKIDAISQERALGQISASQEIAQKNALLSEEFEAEAQHESRVFQLKMQALQDQLALYTVEEGERARLLNDIEQLEAAHAQRMQVITARQAQTMTQANQQAAQNTQQKWQSILSPIGQGFNGLFQNLYNRTMTFKDAFLQMCDQILFQFVGMISQMVVRWVAGQIAQTSATTAGVASRTAAEQAGGAAGLAASAGTTLAQIGNSAVQAAAGAYAALAAIPFIGPVLAPAAAAAALAAVVGFGASVVSAAGGYGNVEKDQMAMIHKKEMILPASIAQPLRESLSGWSPKSGPSAMGANAGGIAAGAPRGGGDTNFYYQPNSNMQDANLEQMLMKQGSTFKKWIRNEMRNGGKK